LDDEVSNMKKQLDQRQHQPTYLDCGLGFGGRLVGYYSRSYQDYRDEINGLDFYNYNEGYECDAE
jgi:hypothetical protein